MPKNGTGVMSDQAQTVTYVYTKNSDKGKDSERAAAVTVVYVDKDGKEIHAAKTIQGNIGDHYDATTKEYQLSINGYHLDESQLPENRIGKLGKEPQTITYVYTKDASPAKTSTSEQKNKTSTSKKENTNYQKDSESKAKLPQTNDVSKIYLNLIGIGLVSFIGFYLIKRRK